MAAASQSDDSRKYMVVSKEIRPTTGGVGIQVRLGPPSDRIPPPSEAERRTARAWARITGDPIRPDELIDFCTNPSAGGIGVFLGTTRDSFKGKTVTRLEYEGYSEMAAAVGHRLCEEAIGTFKLQAAGVFHRLGSVPVKETSVVVVASSEHRREAMAAAGWLIDEVKARLPVWKLEWYEGDSRAWKENCECAFEAMRRQRARFDVGGGGGGDLGGAGGGGGGSAEKLGCGHASHSHSHAEGGISDDGAPGGEHVPRATGEVASMAVSAGPMPDRTMVPT